MRRVVIAFFACAGLGALVAAQPWSARAEEGESVEARLATVERRLADLEGRLAPLLRLMENVELPNLAGARIAANEIAAVATLRNVVSAQAQLQASGKVDVDQDGEGEYGGFLELSGARPGRMAAELFPPVVSGAFRALTAKGEVNRNGYHYRIYLPARDGGCLGEPPGGFTRDHPIATGASEGAWCCYAWPVQHGTSGGHTYFVNEEGSVLACVDSAYGGSGNGPAPDAAYLKPGACAGPAARNAKGNDGNTWHEVP